MLLYLREMSDVEDLGLGNENGAGVITILSDALNWKGPVSYGARSSEEPWMDVERYFCSSQYVPLLMHIQYRSRDDAAKMCHALNLQDFITVDVRHRTRCYGVVVKHTEGWSVVSVIIILRASHPTDIV